MSEQSQIKYLHFPLPDPSSKKISVVNPELDGILQKFVFYFYFFYAVQAIMEINLTY